MRTLSTRLIPAALSLALAAACTPVTSDEEAVENQLELENAGLTMDDEPALNEDAVLGEVGVIGAPEAVNDDSMEADPAVGDMAATPGAEVYGAALVWGQLPPDPENTTSHDWSGTISVSRGAILVRSVIRMEDATDRLLPRDDRATVRFDSRTLPAFDGLRLEIIDPTPASADPIRITYTGNDGTVVDAPLRDLVDGTLSRDIDSAGNRLAGVAFRRPAADDRCNHAFMHGRWHQLRPGLGRLWGRIVSGRGEPIGHMRGVYGVRRDGSQVFFGKYVGLDGRFRGIFAGTYGDGEFHGRWLDRSGEHGILGGRYRETRPGDEVGGHFIGRLLETSCEPSTSP